MPNSWKDFWLSKPLNYQILSDIQAAKPKFQQAIFNTAKALATDYAYNALPFSSSIRKTFRTQVEKEFPASRRFTTRPRPQKPNYTRFQKRSTRVSMGKFQRRSRRPKQSKFGYSHTIRSIRRRSYRR